MGLGEQRGDFFGSGASLCSSDLGLVKGLWSELSLSGSGVERVEESGFADGALSEARV